MIGRPRANFNLNYPMFIFSERVGQLSVTVRAILIGPKGRDR